MTRLYDLRLKTEFCDNEALYFRATDCELNGNAVDFLQGGKLKFNTYFNCLSYSKLQRFTTLSHLVYDLKMQGRFVVRIKQVMLTEGIKKRFEDFDESILYNRPFAYPTGIDLDGTVIFEKEVEGDAKLPLDISNLGGEGFCYLELEALEDCAKFLGGSLFTTDEKSRDPKIAIAICTYRREKYVLNNIANLRKAFKENPVLNDSYDLIVVDNGQTLDIENTDKVRVVKNKNLGGSGGFTRGIIEAYSAGKYTHFLLQDDDIVFDPQMLERVLVYLSYAKNERLAVGAAMLRLDKMHYQYEMGAIWKGSYIKSNCRGYDISKPIDILRNEEQKKTTYNAWWFMCEPVDVVDKFGLPLPLFIKGDDIEYSLRTADEIMTINGLGVWHESFDSKYSGELEYYVKRNELIVGALHSKHVLKINIGKLFRSIGKQLIYQRYIVADFVLEGYRDFLKGPKFLLDLDGEKLHQSLRARTIKQYNKEELREQGFDVDKMSYYHAPVRSYAKKMLTLNGYLIPDCFYDKKEMKEGRLVSLTKSKPRDFFKSKLTVQYDADTDRGFVTRQQRFMIIKYGFKFVAMAIRLIFGYGPAKRKYKKYLGELSSFENWNKLLKME